MFMSTRYNKRREPSIQQRQIFSVDDSLAKLCEYLTSEFSCNKLITPKYKDFRSQKLKFDQKTRLNNAIWRAWHIQYKQNKKARFLQFEAPFSDENAHSTSQAVILDGNYWKRRWDSVAREFKKWRRLYKEKLLSKDDVDREELEASEDSSQSSVSDDEDAEGKRSALANTKKVTDVKTNKSSMTISNTFDSISAMFVLPDTLFSSVDQQKKKNEPELSLFKDSSGMIQPTLDHLNPCFDELMENFDFLFTDWDNYNHTQNSNQIRDTSDIMLNNYPSNESQNIPANHFPPIIPHNIPERNSGLLTPENRNPSSENLNRFVFPSSDTSSSVNDNESGSSLHKFHELPPQLQAPNLAAHVKASMSTRPRTITRNKSDPSLSSQSKRSAINMSWKESPGSHPKRARIIHNSSGERLTSYQQTNYHGANKPEYQHIMPAPRRQETVLFHANSRSQFPTNISQNVSKSTSKTIPILPKYSASAASTNRSSTHYTGIHHDAQLHQKNEPVTKYNFATIATTSQVISTMVASTTVNAVTSFTPATINSVSVRPVPAPNQQTIPSNQPSFAISGPTQNSSVTPGGNIGVVTANQVNEQQLLTLAQLLQSSPAQSTEATLSYLELLQQQLNLMYKQQHEQIQMKQHIQQQAEKMLQQQQQQQHQQQQQATPDLQSDSQSNSMPQLRAIPPAINTNQTDYLSILNVGAAPLSNKSTLSFDGGKDLNTNYILPRTPSTSKPPSIASSSSVESPKVLKKESTSLVKALQRMGSVDGAHIQDSLGTKFSSLPPSNLTAPLTIETHPPARLDSAIALVSLRHGKISPMRSTHNDPDRLSVPVEFDSESIEFPADPIHNPISSSMVPKPITQVANRDIYNEHRRKCHLSAEQKRRGLIKNAFEELANLLPNTIGGRGNKLSNAAILQRTCDHIHLLQHERASSDTRMNQVQQQIEEMNIAISECQNKLPATGISVPRQASNMIQKSFFNYCKELIYSNPKSWIFCLLMKPLFESYNSTVVTKTVDEFLNSVSRWLDQHCTLPLLRPVVLEALTKLSTSTSILDDPNCLNTIAEEALLKDDPTDLSQTPKETTPSQRPGNESNDFSLHSPWNASWRK